MLFKLAFRNVRRQMGNYLVYFITVSLTIALMFAFNCMIFEKQLLAKASTVEEIRAGLIAVTIIISLIVAFVLGYATSFLLKLRKREFGTYLTLGMTRRNILAVFLSESLILCGVSLGVGILFGLIFYQGIMAIVTNIMEINFTFSAYSLQGMFLTVGLVILVFILSSLTSAIYLRKVSIYSLIHAERKSEKQTKRPAIWFAITIISLGGLIASCIVLQQSIRFGMSEGNISAATIFISILTLALSIILFHIGAAKSIFFLLLRSRRIKNRATNTFTLRQLSGKMSANSVMLGALAFLISFAIIGANFSFLTQISNRAALDRDYPFDILYTTSDEQKSPISPEEAEQIIAGYVPIENKTEFSTYNDESNYLYDFTCWNGEGYELLSDIFMKESDFNALNAMLGRKPIDLNGGFKIVINPLYAPQINEDNFSTAVLQRDTFALSFKGFSEAPLRIAPFSHFFAVVPDRYVSGMQINEQGIAYALQNIPFDARALHDALTYEIELMYGSEHYFSSRCDYSIREYGKLLRNTQSAVLTVAALYIAVVFILLSIAILALKTLSSLSEDRKRYYTLFRIGAGKKEQRRSLFLQTFIFFFLPFAIPMLLSIPTCIVGTTIIQFAGFALLHRTVLAAVSIAAAISLIYTLYFTATYLLSKRALIQSV